MVRGGVEWLLKRDRLIVAAGLVILAGAAWAYTLWLALGMQRGPMPWLMAMPQMGAWTLRDLLLTGLMWFVMMVAMMAPAAAPMVLLTAAVERRQNDAGVTRTTVFLAGYLVVWGLFSVVATFLQWGLHDGALLRGAMGATVPLLGAAILIGAGLYQMAPLKAACLNQCRSPISFLTRYWRQGSWGAFIMGLRHGAFCVGCCWALMAILFAAGIMNPTWIAGLTAVVLIERLAPQGLWIGRLLGVGLIAWGVWLAIPGG